MALGAIQYVAVTWTTGDVATEVKMDNMVANDQAYDSHAAQGMLLNNNVGYFQKDSGGTNREILNLDGADALQVGDGVNDITFNQLAWDNYTPTYANLTVGDGTNEGYWKQIGKTVVFRTLFVFGTTSAVGGNPTITVPTAANTTNLGSNTMFAHTTFLDSGTAIYLGGLGYNASATAMLIFTFGTAAAYAGRTTLSNTVPFTWATGDELACYGTYEAA